jgi:heavy metal sensor kinase
MYSEKLSKIVHSLSFRLTLWYAAVFILSSCVAFLLFYVLITSVVRQRIDDDLREEVVTFSNIFTIDGLQAVERLAVLEAQAAGEKKIFFRILSLNGEVFSSSNMSYWENIGISRKAIARLLRGDADVFETIAIPDRKGKVRILYQTIGEGIILQLGRSMENYSGIIDAFKNIFVVTMSVLFGLAAVIGWFMARKALSGVADITRTAGEIAEGALEKRVPVKTGGDEIDRLAETFNKMLDRIQLLLREIKEMSDNIAHDLKSPVTRIRGIAEVNLTTGTSLGDYENMTAGIIEECDRLLDMINTMLMISKTEAGVGEFLPGNIDLAEVISKACELFRPMAEDKEIAMTCNVPQECFIEGDVRMIQRMTANLLDNAIKYTRAGGTVDVSVRADGHQAVISVQDSGTGISGDDLPHIFDRFYRCDPSRSQAGTGLGLSLARAIARAHGGEITVQSRPGEGSIFTVFLPATQPS